eukprot:gene32779-55312_t
MPWRWRGSLHAFRVQGHQRFKPIGPVSRHPPAERLIGNTNTPSPKAGDFGAPSGNLARYAISAKDAVRKLHCATRLDAYTAKVYTNTVKGLGQLSVRLKDADIIVLVRERTQITRQLIEKLPRLKLI